MGYEPLHHKYRPQNFSQLVGQDAIAQTLSHALEQQRIAPAYLFCGPRGTGKTSSARILAKSLNCLSHTVPNPQPCGQCEVCRGISNGSILDIVEIDAASNTGVDNIRELIERAQFAPVQCRYKVYVVDECLTGDTLVQTRSGFVRIDDPQIEGQQVLSYNEQTGSWEYKKAIRWFDQGTRDILEIQTTHRKIRCTDNHLIRTDLGWVAARDVKEGITILSPASVVAAPSSTNMERMDECAALPKAISLKAIPTEKSPIASTISLPRKAGLQTCSNTPFPQWHTNLETVVSVRPAGREPVYDIEVEDNHNFVANGLLVHNCHMLSTAAFNALLKTLEEPPEHVIFVLATTDPQRVLPTIISRCQRFDFRRIPLEAMVSHLQAIAQQESIDITEDAVRLVAQVAQGGLRDAESLLDQLSLLEPPITAEKVWDLVGAVPERDLLELVKAIAADDSVTTLDTVRRLMDRGREPMIVLQNLAGFYRDLIIAKTAGGRADLVPVTPPTWEAMKEFSQSVALPLLLVGQKTLREAETQLRNTTQPRLWLEVTLMNLLPSAQVGIGSGGAIAAAPVQPAMPAPPPAAPPRPASPPPAVAAPSPPTPSPQPTAAVQPSMPAPHNSPPERVTPAEEPPPSPPADSTPAAVPAGDMAGLWAQIIAQVKPLGTRALLQQQGHLISYSGQAARVGIKSDKLLKMAQSKLPNIEAAFAKLLGQSVKVTLEVADAPPGSESAANPSPSPHPSGNHPSGKQPTAPVDTPRTPPPPPAASPPIVSEDTAAASPFPAAPAAPATSASWQPESDLDRAVKSFAEFFNGQIVDMEDGVEAQEQNGQASKKGGKSKPSSSPGSDVPF